jgi:hypothetical protein
MIQHTSRFSAPLVFYLNSGGRLKADDNDLEAVTTVLNGFVRNTYPDSNFVDSFPLLHHSGLLLGGRLKPLVSTNLR